MREEQGELRPTFLAACGLCGRKKFDFDPAWLAAVKEFISVDGGSG
jgi:hypothetical protein